MRAKRAKSSWFQYLVSAFFSISLLSGCLPVGHEEQKEIVVEMDDATFREIVKHQNRQQADSLMRFFKNSNPVYRYYAAQAFASFQTEEAIDTLGFLLEDPQLDVAAVAAYAIGQIGSEKGQAYLVNAFQSKDSARIYRSFNRAVLEAIGKCGNQQHLDYLGTIKTYGPKDTALLEGQAWGLYRYGLRGMTTADGTETMASFLERSNIPPSVKLIAANYMFRFNAIQTDSLRTRMDQVIRRSKSPEIRMTLATALGNTGNADVLRTLFQLYDWETDYRVKCNLLRAFENFPYNEVKPYLYKGVNDFNPHVSYTAARTLAQNGDAVDGYHYLEMARKYTGPWRTKIELYGAALDNLPLFYLNSKRVISSELKTLFNNTSNHFEKAEIIKTLGRFPSNYDHIQKTGFSSVAYPVRTASVEALAHIARDENFERFFRSSSAYVRGLLKQHFLDAILSNDVGMTTVAGNALADESLTWDLSEEDIAVLRNAEKTLKVPKEIEALQAIHNAMDRFEIEKQVSSKSSQAPNIRWKELNGLSETSKAVVHTSKGIIEIQLMPFAAPGTVANFVRLSRDGFFNSKVFHRVVPNFVAQGGCPRGDGYGALDYSIRSELAHLHYDDGGYVGMASAGNHTECTQWFITHSPTPHLDGDYTIFGKVIVGMDIVHDLQIGDSIDKIFIVP